MSEIIDIRDRSSASHFLVASVSDSSSEDRDKLFADGGPWGVTFKLNGVDIPFTATLEDIYQRFNRQVDERAKEMAVEMFNTRIKERVFDIIYNLENEFKDSIDL